MSQKYSNNYLLFYVKKPIKECPVPLNISIKSNRNTIKQFYIVNLTKTWLGNFLGDLFTKTSGHPGYHDPIGQGHITGGELSMHHDKSF